MAAQWDEFEQFFQAAHMGGSDLSNSCKSLPPATEESGEAHGQLAGTHKPNQTCNSLRPATDNTRRRHSFHRSTGPIVENGEFDHCTPSRQGHKRRDSEVLHVNSRRGSDASPFGSRQKLGSDAPPFDSYQRRGSHSPQPEHQKQYLLGYQDSDEEDDLLGDGVKHSKLTRMVSSPGQGSPRLTDEERVLRSQSVRQKRTSRGGAADHHLVDVNDDDGAVGGEEMMNCGGSPGSRVESRADGASDGRCDNRPGSRADGRGAPHVSYSPQPARRVGSEKFSERKTAQPRHYSMPVKRRGPSTRCQLQPPQLNCPGEEDEQDDDDDAVGGIEVLRVRSFSTKSGGLVNRGDSFKVKSRTPKMSSGRRKSSMRCSPPDGSPGAAAGSSGSYNRSLQHVGVGDGDAVAPGCEVRVQLTEDGPGGVQQVTTQVHYPQLIPPPSGTPLSQSASAYNLNKGLQPGSISAREARHSCSEVFMTSDMMNSMAAVAAAAAQQEASGMSEGAGEDSEDEEDEEDEDSVLRVLVLGTQGVGKTTLTSQLLTSEYLANSDNLPGEWDFTDLINPLTTGAAYIRVFILY